MSDFVGIGMMVTTGSVVVLLAVEQIRTLRARRAEIKLRAQQAEARAELFGALSRSSDEIGRKLASGAEIQEAFMAGFAVPCPDPNCKCKKGAGNERP